MSTCKRRFDVPVHESAAAATPGGCADETQGRESPAPTSCSALPHSSRGQAFPSPDEMRSALADGIAEIVWACARRDYRTQADWMEDLAARIHEKSEEDRAAAKRRERGDPPRPTRIERARQELRGAYSAICELERVLRWTHDAKDRASAIRASLASALAILEEVGR